MSGQPDRAIRSVLICGGGIVAWSAALAFARALPAASHALLALPVPDGALADRVPASLPSVGRFHASVGIEELELVSRGAALHQLGTRFERWSASGESWVHAHGEYGVPGWPVPFRDLWARARKAGRAGAVHSYCAAGVMAEAGKFVHPRPDGAWPFSTYRYGLRFDPDLYLGLLEQRARGSGVERVDGAVSGIERDGQRIAAVIIEGGRRLEADLFVDCTGPGARLLAEVAPEFESWAELFPFDRLHFDAGAAAVSPADRVVAATDGWTWTLPLPDRSLVVAASAGGEGARVRFGHRREPWVGNVLALGDSAQTIDPLHGVSLHLVHSGILRALELLPGRDFHPVELAEYNRRADQEVTRARDFLALHYVRSGRSEGEGWRDAAAARLPASLSHTLDQFEARGRLPFFEQESFTVDSWSAALLGLGALPKAPDAIAARFPFEESVASLEALADRLRMLPDKLPAYPDYLRRMTESAPGARTISSPAAS